VPLSWKIFKNDLVQNFGATWALALQNVEGFFEKSQFLIS
jgi:hypothetical protein